MSDFLYGSICLSDIPKEHIISHANGKKYVNIAISKRKEKGKYGETHTISVSVPKEKRQPNDRTIYVGNLKTWENNNQQSNTGSFNNPADDDLPF